MIYSLLLFIRILELIPNHIHLHTYVSTYVTNAAKFHNIHNLNDRKVRAQPKKQMRFQ